MLYKKLMPLFVELNPNFDKSNIWTSVQLSENDRQQLWLISGLAMFESLPSGHHGIIKQ